MAEKRSKLIDLGQLGAPFGVKGWIKVSSGTEPKENILSYTSWWLKTRHGVKAVEIEEAKVRSDDIVVKLKGVEDRDQAAQLAKVKVAVEREQLPELEDGEFYWHQLVGMQVISEFEGQSIPFGKVKQLIETGANDVLVIQADETSIDEQERLVPYVPGQYVKNVDVENGQITVEWDPEF
ncbi:MAG: ribosome maturation factor RimM [Agarilytica sp.]